MYIQMCIIFNMISFKLSLCSVINDTYDKKMYV